MDFYFTDRKFNFLGIASTSSEAPISIYNDKDELSISAASRTFEGTLIFSDKERDKVKAMANYGNYILYKDENGQSVFMTIMEIEHDPKEGEHFIRAEDAGMDLINGLVDAYSAPKAMTFAEYFKLFAGDTGFEIGINEISNLSRTLKWESESQTILARLLSLANQFDNAEISFSFEITGTQVVKRFVDIRKKRGADNRVTLYMDKDINNIVTKANIYDLCTAIVATGGTPEGKNEPINLKGYSYNDPNGRFVLNKTTGVMQDMESVKIWSRLLSNNNPNPNAGHIQRVKTYETTDQKTLCDNVIRELEKASQPAINYETDIANLPDNVKIGDTIYLVDENEKLFLSARVLELTRCYSTNEYKATLGDYLIQDGGISQSLKELADQLKQATTYVWIRYADDEEGNGISALPAGKTYIAIKQVLGVPTASDDPADYRGLWVKFVGEGVPGPPGENGQPTYTWLKYADDYQGTNMTDDPTGKYYIGLATNKLTATESNDTKDYKWQLVKGEDGQDAHIYQAYSWSPDGTDRFTIPYPNENLFPITRFEKTSTREFVNDDRWDMAPVFEEFGIKKKYTISFDLKSAVAGPIQIYSQNGSGTKYNIGSQSVQATTEYKRYSITVWPDIQTGSTQTKALLAFYGTYDSGRIPTVKNVKIELGEKVTIDTPNPSESFVDAYPSYVGTYTTFDDVQSTNPADYTWQRMLGLSGKDGKDGEQGDSAPLISLSGMSQTITVAKDGTVTPSSSFQVTGTAVNTTITSWTYSVNGGNFGSALPTGVTRSDNIITINPNTSNFKVFTIRAGDGTVSDSYTISRITDGGDGTPGADAYTVFLTNESYTFAGSTAAALAGSTTTEVIVYKGTNKISPTTVSVGTKPTGLSSSVSGSAITFTASTALVTKSGTIPITITADEKTFTKQFAYAISFQGGKGEKGDRGLMGIAYVQQTQPSDTTEGVQWFKTDSTDKKIIASYVYKSGAWQEKKYASATLAVESLDALSANLGNITAGTIDGVEIIGDGLFSDYDYQVAEGSTVWRKGRLSMSDGYFRNDFQTYVKSTGEIQNNGFSQFSHEDIQFVVFNGSQQTKADRYLSINPYRFTMTDSRGLGGNITFQDLYNVGKTGLQPASGFAQYNTSPSSSAYPTALRQGRIVQLSGAFKNNSAIPGSATERTMGTLPDWARPVSSCNFVVQGSGMNRYLLTITTDGKINFSRYGTGDQYGNMVAESWLNIACLYSAADV